MRKAGIKSITRQKYRVQTTDSNHLYVVAENYLNRDIFAQRLAEKWVSDSTYIRTEEGWLYLTSILDLADRKVIGWALKTEIVYHRRFTTRSEAKLAVFEYIEGWYNRKRRYSALG